MALEEVLRRHGALALVLLAVTVFLTTYQSKVDVSFSDPSRTLLTAQALVQTGSLKLDAYLADERYIYGPIEPAANGHFYDYFPLGTAFLAVPAVWLALLRGEDMIYPEDNAALQNSLSSLVVVLCALLVVALCRHELSRRMSALLTLVFVFGSSAVSTLGTALWSSGPALLLGLVCFLLLQRADDSVSHRPDIGAGRQLALGGLVFFGYLCRPTMALLALVIAAYLWVRERRIPWLYLTTLVGGFGLFVLFSWQELGQGLPAYYLPSRLGSDGRFAEAFYGNMLSPSRGILVLMPYLWLPLAGLVAWQRRWIDDRLVTASLVWVGLHWCLVSSFAHWWGGWSFGNRLFIEVLPALILVTIRTARLATRQLPPRALGLATTLFALLGVFATFVHTHQGLFNVYTVQWSRGIDRDPSRIFDWKHPQFLATPSSVGSHPREHKLLANPAYVLGGEILPTTATVVFEGWSIPEGEGRWRWSNSHDPSVLFKIEDPRWVNRELILEVETGTYQPQTVEVRLNGVLLGSVRSELHWEPAVYHFEVSEQALDQAREPIPGSLIHRLDFSIPGAVEVGEGPEQRLLGLCLRKITLREPRR